MSRKPTDSKSSLLTFAVLAAVLAAVALPHKATADDTFSLLLQGGVGGPVNEDSTSNAGFETAFQLGFTVASRGDIQVGGRAGRVDYSPGDQLGPFAAPTLDYLTLGGDYRFNEGFYQSGIFIGLGYYSLEGDVLIDPEGTTETRDETGVGLAIGVTGEFELAPKLGFVVEAIGHITDLQAQDLFVTVNAGFAFHF